MSVTVLDTSSWTAAERQAAARDAYRASGHRLSGADLGRQFGRSGRWGRAQIQAAATEDIAAAAPAATGSPVDAETPPVAATQGRDATEAPPVAATGSPPDAKAPTMAAAGGMPKPADVPALVRWASSGAVVAVALVAAVASYAHMLDLAHHAGEGWLAWLLPVSVDGLVVAGSTTMVLRRREGHGGGCLAWLAVGLGLGASLAANVVAADPSLVDPAVVRRLIAGWPPVALAISAELAIQLRAASGQGDERPPLRRKEYDPVPSDRT